MFQNVGLETVLNSESSRRMVTSFKNSHAEEIFGKPLMANGDCTFLAQPKYKRYKVSAIRDFPAGCGMFASRIDPMPKVDVAAQPKYKRRKVSASRDFPAGCGLFASRIDPMPKVDVAVFCSANGTVVEDENGKYLGGHTVRTSKHEAEPRHYEFQKTSFLTETLGQTIECSLKKENLMVSSHHMDVPPLANNELAKVQLVSMEALEDTELTRAAKAVKCDSSNMLSKSSAPEDEVVFSGRSKLFSSDVNIAGSSACLEKAVTKRYFPQRRVSAVRDFPPLCGAGSSACLEKAVTKRYFPQRRFSAVRDFPHLCGHNALHLSEDECLKGISSLENKSMCRQNMAADNRLLKKATATDAKKVKSNFFALLDRSKAAIKTKESPNHSGKKPLKMKYGNGAFEGTDKLIIWEKKDFLDHLNKNIKEFLVVQKSYGFKVDIPPFGQYSFSGDDSNSNVSRNKVRETLRLFHAVSRKLLQEEESKLKEQANTHRRTDLQAAKILKDKGKYVNTGKQIVGSVPGVEVGDEFHYRVELNMIGLHRQIQGGIDYVKHDGKMLATSIVASGGYADEMDNSDVLIYTGQGGNVMNTGKEPEDQKLKRGNLSLKNSCKEKNPVRVIRGSESMDGKHKTYVYDGLYLVETCWQDMGPHGKLVFKFQLRRLPGQPELARKEVKKLKKFKTREGLCVDDISHGKELIPICAVNIIDDEKPPMFKYVTSMTYPDWCKPIPPKGCDCTNGCSDLEKCYCAVKNGGEIPFNHNGAIVKAKPLVYECGPSCNCKCSSTCYNRVSQHGIKFRLEIFKTQLKGWGVRSLNSIPSGSFICEYIGELLGEKEAEQRTGNDEYLFDIGNDYNDTLWDGLSTLMPEAQSASCDVVADGGFTIDAAHYGNVGRFINHSCSPNLYAQNVLYDHDDKRIPHIMLFAAENIPHLQELTYDYNYMIGQIHDSDGNIKKKDCHCGSVECKGRMY